MGVGKFNKQDKNLAIFYDLHSPELHLNHIPFILVKTSVCDCFSGCMSAKSSVSYRTCSCGRVYECCFKCIYFFFNHLKYTANQRHMGENGYHK